MTTTDLDFLLIEEVSELIRVPATTLRYWRSLGRGPKSRKHGGRVVYLRSDVLAWVEAQDAETARGGVA